MNQNRTGFDACTEAFHLGLPEDRSDLRLATAWLLLAVGSLVVAGLYTFLIVLSRTPFFQEIVPWVDFFHTALVVHVDLTVLVWFLGYAGMFWTLNSRPACKGCGWSAFWMAVAGTGVMVASPFLGAGDPLMNNYVPVLQAPLFLSGLGLFGLGFLLLVVRGLLFSRPVGAQWNGEAALRFGGYTALIAGLVAMLALFLSWQAMPPELEGEYYYELLFWGGGHSLQFVHIQLMLVAWLVLATQAGLRPRMSPRVALLLFALGILPVLLTVWLYLTLDPASGRHYQGISELMKYGGGLAALPVGLVIAYSAFTTLRGDIRRGPEANALLFSMLLFGVGGIIGFLISGSNVTVPAHYHGSIVGVTLAFMGITYHLLPRLGFRAPDERLACLQPVIYGIGQLMHVTGLAWSGGYGVQRKTAGAAQGLDAWEKVAGMGLMGLGGLVAIIGGLLFLVVVFKAMWPRR